MKHFHNLCEKHSCQRDTASPSQGKALKSSTPALEHLPYRADPPSAPCTFCFSEWLLACLAASASNCSYCLCPWYSRTRFSCTQARSGWLLKNWTWYSRAPARANTSQQLYQHCSVQLTLSSSPELRSCKWRNGPSAEIHQARSRTV